MSLDQNQVNKLYEEAYIRVTDAAKLIGASRQGVWYLMTNDKLDYTKVDGESYVDTSSLRNYVLKRRKELLEKLDSLKLPN